MYTYITVYKHIQKLPPLPSPTITETAGYSTDKTAHWEIPARHVMHSQLIM